MKNDRTRDENSRKNGKVVHKEILRRREMISFFEKLLSHENENENSRRRWTLIKSTTVKLALSLNPQSFRFQVSSLKYKKQKSNENNLQE